MRRNVVMTFIGANLCGGVLACVGGLIEPWDTGFSPRDTAIGAAIGVGILVWPMVRFVGAVVERGLDAGEEALAIPRRLAAIGLASWLLGAAVAGVAFSRGGILSATQTAIWTAAAGVVTAGVTFLLVERALRPHFAAVLSGRGNGTRFLSLRSRILICWVLGAGAPLLVIGAIAVGPKPRSLAATDWSVVVVGLIAGLFLFWTLAHAIADPMERLHDVLADVEAGNLDGGTVVDDVGEVGRLQAGFNSMLQGLRERQALHAALGAYLDEEVARRIVQEGVLLKGEEADVTVMFLDLRNFTAFCEQTSAEKAVERLNAVWETVIPILHAAGGHANKFVGDAVLAVFGTPLHVADHAERAVGAACDIADAIEYRFGHAVQTGIGINSGRVLAGTLGGGGRLEFTVIGDAVNVASRVQDLTKESGDQVLVTEATRALLGDSGRGLLPRGEVSLRGKAAPVAVYAVPRAVSGSEIEASA